MHFSNLKNGLLIIFLSFQSFTLSTQLFTKRELLEKREIEARELAIRSLPDFVQEDLAKMDERDYELDWESFARDYDEKTNSLVEKRQQDNAGGLGAKHCKNGKIAMTQDDGPYHWTGKLAQEYGNVGFQSTYFINVQNWDCSYDLEYVKQLRKAIRLNQEIGSHTGTHADLTKLSMDEIAKQIRLVEKFTWKTLGLIPANMRPPYGNTSPEINAFIRSKGYRVVQWAVDAGDATGSTTEESLEIIKDQVKLNSGKIVLTHETHSSTVLEIVPKIIEYFEQEGIKSVSISECLQTRAYKVKKNKFPPLNDSLNCMNQHVPLPGKS